MWKMKLRKFQSNIVKKDNQNYSQTCHLCMLFGIIFKRTVLFLFDDQKYKNTGEIVDKFIILQSFMFFFCFLLLLHMSVNW